MVKSEELIGIKAYLKCCTRRRTNRCRYNGDGLYGLSYNDFIAKLVSLLHSEGFWLYIY